MGFDLNHDEGQRQICDAASAMLAADFPLARLREGARDDLAPLVDFGLFALSASEEQGGAGFSIVEDALVHTRLGRHLVSTRALATAVAANAARELGKTELAAKLVSGAIEACAALKSGGDILLIDHQRAALGTLFDNSRVALIDLSDANPQPAAGLGLSVPVARMRCAEVKVIAETTAESVTAIASLLACAQLLGVAETARDLAVAYAQIRRQFGKPIGAFQAIKHHCANMAIAAEMVSAQLDMAAIGLREARADARFQVAALQRLSSRAALANARTCIQIHGGIGFSAEADAHHFLKRAHVLSQLCGDARMLDFASPMAPYRPLHERP